jgi:putative transposase
MIRHRLTDAQWTRIENLIPGKPGDPGRTGDDNRLFRRCYCVDGANWGAMARSSSRLCNWNSVFRRFRRWAKAGVWERIMATLADDPDFEFIIIDGTIIRAHQHAAGGKGGFKNRRSGDRAED